MIQKRLRLHFVLATELGDVRVTEGVLILET